MGGNRWLRPEVYPLFAAVGVAVGICGLSMVRHICFNPEVRESGQIWKGSVSEGSEEEEWKLTCITSFSSSSSEVSDLLYCFLFERDFGLVLGGCISSPNWVNKENRAAGVLENFSEGERYAEHSIRKYVRNKSPEIMPGINGFFSNPK